MYRVEPLSIRSKAESISASDWLSILTLCFAPIIVHIISGIPNPVYLRKSLPSWHDTICFFNPTTIVWWYMALTDRRIRCKNWDSFHMAASNTRFWTEEGWNGSEEMIQKSMIICTRVAHKPRMKFMSRTAAETLVVAIQGVQSVIELTGGGVGGWQISLATIFYPLAFLGLLRLPAAYWISDEATYAEYHSQIGKFLSDSGGYELYRIRPKEGAEPFPNEKQMTYDSHPVNNWRGCMVRISFLLIITGFSAAGIAFVLPLMPPEWTYVMSATNYVEVCFYTFVTIPMLGILMFYSFQNPRTTIVPCVQSLWYKIYTVLLFVFMLVYISIAALETRKSPCGTFTTLTGSAQCVDGEGGVRLSSAVAYEGAHEPDGIYVSRLPFNVSLNTATSASKEFDGVFFGYSNGSQTFVDMVPFDGWCKGSLSAQMTHIEMPQRHLANSSDWFSNLVGIPEFTANIKAYQPREGL
ncbi:hypothetical protein HYFRA_00001182 [Hymenoscyphus fraxineus]|uniref:Uncharacterized protein n=1 Tax=Hymenoscyphus fraxineus TaxID=746836 RepID=A0A9N9KQV2_9HELO|nr:hypothetical protein HYFRA_00001182 [Hymenoscyphus fraxineus]